MRRLLLASSSYWPVFATLFAVAGFLGANVYSQRDAKAIHTSARSIATNGAPSIRYLSDVRGVMHQMQTAVGLAVAAASRGQPLDRAVFRKFEKTLSAEMQTYLALPFYPGESELAALVTQSIDDFEHAADRAIALSEEGNHEAARRTVRVELAPLGEHANEVIGRLIDFNDAHVSESSAHIDKLQRRMVYVSYVLHGMAGAVSIILTVLVTLAVRQRMALSLERHRLAEARAEEMEQFAGRVAHDLKSPLGAICLRLTLMQRKHPGDVSLVRLSEQALTMNRTIDGLLSFAVSGGVASPGAQAELAGVVAETLDSLEEETEAAGADLKVDECPTVYLAIAESALSSVLSNLLRNAVKYVGDGENPERKIRIRAVRLGNGRCRVEITDTGPGIPPEQREIIFEPFVRVGQSQRPGIGLGLATVKRLLEAYGGEVGVEPGFECGSRFWFELPEAPNRDGREGHTPPGIVCPPDL